MSRLRTADTLRSSPAARSFSSSAISLGIRVLTITSGSSVDVVIPRTYEAVLILSTEKSACKHEPVLTRLDSGAMKAPIKKKAAKRAVLNVSVGWDHYNWLSTLPATEGEGANRSRHARKAIVLYRRMLEEGSLEKAERTLTELHAAKEAAKPVPPDVRAAVAMLGEIQDADPDLLRALEDLGTTAKTRSSLARTLKDLAVVARDLAHLESVAGSRGGQRKTARALGKG